MISSYVSRHDTLVIFDIHLRDNKNPRLWDVFLGKIHVGFIEQRSNSVYYFFDLNDQWMFDGVSLVEIKRQLVEAMKPE